MLDLGPFNPNLQGLYTDLDSLFDTRFAVLEQIDRNFALEVLKRGWSNRTTDVFAPLTRADFKELYRTRDTKVLALAPQTLMILSIKRWLKQAMKIVSDNPFPTKIEVFVNVHPYRLSIQEAREIGADLSKQFGDLVVVHMVNASPEKICTRTAKRYFSAMFMYDYDQWLEHHTSTGGFEDMRIPGITLYAPKLLKEGEVAETDARDMAQKKIDLFLEFERLASPQIGLEFIDLPFFCHDMPTDFADHYDAATGSIKTHHKPAASAA